jgi:hypothetical protein
VLRPLALPLGLDRAYHFVHLSTTELVRRACVFKIGFVSVGALYCRVNETRAVLAESLEECTCVSAVFGAGTLIAGIKSSLTPIRSEVWSIPQIHQAEHPLMDPPHAGLAVAFKKVQFL